MADGRRKKQFVAEQDLLLDSYRLGVQIFESGFRPDYIAGVWRGGSTVGIYVQECLQYLGVETDHIAIRTSYRGMDDYLERINSPQDIRVHGLQYLLDTMNHEDSLLIVDDVYATGNNVGALVKRLRNLARKNMPGDVRIASIFYRTSDNAGTQHPDYYLHEVDSWLVLPYELTGISRTELEQHKPWIIPVLDSCSTKAG